MIRDIQVLILQGGASRRMGIPKHRLRLPSGLTQLDSLAHLCHSLNLPVSLSIAHPDNADPRFPALIDAHPGSGPLHAIASLPPKHWLILSIDLVLLDAPTLLHLLHHHSPSALATCYNHRLTGQPEPFPAILSPRAISDLATSPLLAQRRLIPWLLSLNPVRLTPPTTWALDAVNDPIEWQEAIAKLTLPTTSRPFLLTDPSPFDPSLIPSTSLSHTLGGLFKELAQLHPRQISPSSYTPFLNHLPTSWDTPWSPSSTIHWHPTHPPA